MLLLRTDFTYHENINLWISITLINQEDIYKYLQP